jgi:hypothetical protein
MNCLHCNAPNEAGAKFCKNCGAGLPYAPPVAATMKKNDVAFLTAYIGWHFLTFLIYTCINKIVIPKIIRKETSFEIDNLYKRLDWVLSGIDIAFLIVLIIFLKSQFARLFAIVFLVIRVGLLLLYQFF